MKCRMYQSTTFSFLNISRKRYKILNIIIFKYKSIPNLPRQLSPAPCKMNEDIAHGFQIISPGRLKAAMTVDGSEPGRAHQILSLPERNVLEGAVLTESVASGQAEIDQKQSIRLVVHTHQKVLGLDIAMDEPGLMDVP